MFSARPLLALGHVVLFRSGPLRFLAAAAALPLLFASDAVGSDVSIDPFFIGAKQSAYASNFMPNSNTKFEDGLTPGAILGGRHDFVAEYLGGDSEAAGDYTMDIYSEFNPSSGSANFLLWNYGTGTDTARAKMIWGGGGDLNRDLTAQNSFLLSVYSSEVNKSGVYTGEVDIRLTVVSSAGTATATRSVSHTFTPKDLVWFFSEFPGVDFADVDRIELSMEETLLGDSFYQVIFDEFVATTSEVPAGGLGISAISVSGSDVTLTATNGLASASYVAVTSTDPTLPLAQWTRVATNKPATDGTFTVTAPGAAAPGTPVRVFSLKAE